MSESVNTPKLRKLLYKPACVSKWVEFTHMCKRASGSRVVVLIRSSSRCWGAGYHATRFRIPISTNRI